MLLVTRTGTRYVLARSLDVSNTVDCTSSWVSTTSKEDTKSK